MMRNQARNHWLMGAAIAVGLGLLSGCNRSGADPSAYTSSDVPTPSVQSGTRVDVTLADRISSEDAHVGDAWHGTVAKDVATENGGTIAAGSQVDGVVANVVPAKRGTRAMLELAVRTIWVNGNDVSIAATSEPVVAGSPRARNLGAIAGGAAAGALIGKTVGDGKNGTVGGVIGGAAATGIVAGSKGFQVVLPEGVVMTFTVSETVALR